MKKKLPIYFPPISDSYSSDASIASVLQAFDIYNPDLFLNRLYLFKKPNNVIKFATIQKNFDFKISCYNDNELLEQICNNISQNKYIFLYLDHFFIKGSESYLKYHFAHDFTFIYGFDSQENVLYCADNFVNGKYSCLKISYHDMLAARRAIKNLDIFSNNKNVVLFTYDKPNYILDNSIIRFILEDYLSATHNKILKLNPNFLTDNIFGFSHGQECRIDNCMFGISIYTWLYNEIKKIVKEQMLIDVRPFRLLCNHQAILRHLVMYWNKNNLFNEISFYKFEKTMNTQVTNCFITQNLVLKYNITKKAEIGNNILNKLNSIEKVERNFLEEILSIKEIW